MDHKEVWRPKDNKEWEKMKAHELCSDGDQKGESKTRSSNLGFSERWEVNVKGEKPAPKEASSKAVANHK